MPGNNYVYDFMGVFVKDGLRNAIFRTNGNVIEIVFSRY